MAAVRRLLQRQVEVIVKTPILRPAYGTLKALECTLAELGVEWIAEPEISRSYSGDTYPLEYKMSAGELRKYFVDFPQFRPKTGKSSDPGVRDGMCLAARQHCFIDVFGNVYPCLNFKSAADVKEARGDHAGAKMGNVLESPFESIWNSRIAKTIRAADRSSFAICGGCDAGGSCHGCMALNYEQHGELFRPAAIVCGLTQAAWHEGNPEFVPAGLKPAP
jgi:radical SAM protein with 4Fe4S-binding SPASM domain